jgi:hypothetical protein
VFETQTQDSLCMVTTGFLNISWMDLVPLKFSYFQNVFVTTRSKIRSLVTD